MLERRLRLDCGSGLPALIRGSHQYLDSHVLFHTNLTGKPKLAQYAIFLQALPLDLTHFGLGA